jgi:hypothetical protein
MGLRRQGIARPLRSSPKLTLALTSHVASPGAHNLTRSADMHLLSSSSQLAVSLLLLVPALVSGQVQAPLSDDPHVCPPTAFNTSATPPPSAFFTSTLVDVLSADSSYTTLVRLLQRTKLIPTLNKLNGSTLFAPTNDAFDRAKAIGGNSWDDLLEDEDVWGNNTRPKRPDNILFDLRQHLLYHLLNYTLPYDFQSSSSADGSNPPSLFPNSSEHRPQMLETMLFPSRYSGHKTPQPAPAPPWLPERSGLLGTDGQRIRGIQKAGAESEGSSSEDWVGVDWKGEGGVRVLQVNESGNGLVVKVDGVFVQPENAGQ